MYYPAIVPTKALIITSSKTASICFYYRFVLGHVFIPKRAYNGQKPTRLVRIKTAPKTNSTMPHVPVAVPVKYNMPNTTASTVRMARSENPMLFFIQIDLIKR